MLEKKKRRPYCHSTTLDMYACVCDVCSNEKSSLNGESCWAIRFFTLSFDWACWVNRYFEEEKQYASVFNGVSCTIFGLYLTMTSLT